jgi:GntR family transcriptional regulator
MHLRLTPADDLPIYRQIMRQVADAIAGGKLAAGERLPSHRELSEQLVIAPLTVKKAYDELEKLGYIESQHGRGTFVSATLPRVPKAERNARLGDAARTLLRQAYLAGLEYDDVVALLEDTNRKLTDRPAPSSGRGKA